VSIDDRVCRISTADRQPVQVDGEEDDHHQAEPEVRHRQPDERECRRRVVLGSPASDRRDDTGRDADQRAEQHRQERELERDRDPRDDRVRDRQLPRVEAEVAADRVRDPFHVLHGQRLVEPVLVVDRLDDVGVAVLAAERLRRASRQRPHADEDDDAREEHDDQGGSRLAKEEAAHVVCASSSA